MAKEKVLKEVKDPQSKVEITSIKDLVGETKVINGGAVESVKKEYTAIVNSMNGYDFKNKIKPNTRLISLDEIREGKKGDKSILTLPIRNTSFISLRYNLDEVRDVILNNEKLNPVLETGEKSLIGVESKQGEMYVILNPKILIQNVIRTTKNIATLLPIDERTRINTSLLSRDLLDLCDGYNKDVDLEIGRLNGDKLCLKVNIDKVFRCIIALFTLSNIVKNDIVPFVSLTEVVYQDDNFFVGLEIKPNKTNLNLFVLKNNFVCANVSFTHQEFSRILENKITERYVAKNFKEELDEYLNSESDESELFNLVKNDLEIICDLTSLQSVSSMKNNCGELYSDLIKIDNYNSPMYVPIIGVKEDGFSRDNRYKIKNPLLSRMTNLSKVLDKSKLVSDFGYLFLNNNMFLAKNEYEKDRLVMVPDVKIAGITSLIQYFDDIRDYAISVTSDSNNIAFALQIANVY